MTVVQIEPDKDITIRMEFFKPMKGEGIVHWITKPKSDTSTELIWTFEQNLPYFSRYFGLVMDSMLGQHYERGLTKYKAMVEGSK